MRLPSAVEGRAGELKPPGSRRNDDDRGSRGTSNVGGCFGRSHRSAQGQTLLGLRGDRNLEVLCVPTSKEGSGVKRERQVIGRASSTRVP